MKIELKYFILGIFLVFLIGEIFARHYLGLGTPPLLVSHSKIEYMLKPNQDVYRFGNHFVVNQYGMRSEPFTKEKRSNELRIMIFGDSVVNGGNLIDQAELATNILKDRLTKNLEKNVIVGNISAGSWGPGNWLAYAEEYGFFDADIVVLVISSHDYVDNPTFAPLNKNTHPTQNPISAVVEGIERYLPRYILPVLRNLNLTQTNQINMSPTDEQLIPPEKEIQKGLGDLNKFLQLAKIHSKTVLVFQHYEKSEIETAHAQIGNQRIKEVCQQLEILPVSLEPYFRCSIEEGINPYHDKIHPNNVGQMLIAEAMLSKLIIHL